MNSTMTSNDTASHDEIGAVNGQQIPRIDDQKIQISKTLSRPYETDKYNAYNAEDADYKDFDEVEESFSHLDTEADNINPYGHKNNFNESTKEEKSSSDNEDKSNENLPQVYNMFYLNNNENSDDMKVDSDSDDSESYKSSDEGCKYVIPPPDMKAASSLFNMPPPKEFATQKYIYTLKNGKILVLDHPLPSCLPIEMLSDDGNESNNSEPEDKRKYDWFLYGLSLVLPFTGPIIYAFTRKNRPRFAKRILGASISSISFFAFAAFIFLI